MMVSMGRRSVGLGVSLALVACARGPGGVHTAKILDDVHLRVTVDSFQIAPKEMRGSSGGEDKTSVRFHVAIANPADQRVWANDCHARAYNGGGELLYTFTFVAGFPAGAYIGPGRKFDATLHATAPTTVERAGTTERLSAECAAWDWGDWAPI
jgi:hypothetical protein